MKIILETTAASRLEVARRVTLENDDGEQMEIPARAAVLELHPRDPVVAKVAFVARVEWRAGEAEKPPSLSPRRANEESGA